MVTGEVADKYQKEGEEGPYAMVKTDEKVDDDPDAYLGGFGLECSVGSPKIRFEDEPPEGNEVFNRMNLRDMTPEEKEEHDNRPF